MKREKKKRNAAVAAIVPPAKQIQMTTIELRHIRSSNELVHRYIAHANASCINVQPI